MRQLDHEYRECFRFGENLSSPLSGDSRFSDYLAFRSARIARLISINRASLIQSNPRVMDIGDEKASRSNLDPGDFPTQEFELRRIQGKRVLFARLPFDRYMSLSRLVFATKCWWKRLASTKRMSPTSSIRDKQSRVSNRANAGLLLLRVQHGSVVIHRHIYAETLN